MAAKLSDQVLKQEALRALQEGRAEISLEAQSMRSRLSPRHLGESVLRKHTAGVMVGAVGIGIGLALLLFPRSRHLSAHATKPPATKKEHERPKRTLLKTMLELAVPLVIDKVVAPYLRGCLTGQNRERSPAPRAVP